MRFKDFVRASHAHAFKKAKEERAKKKYGVAGKDTARPSNNDGSPGIDGVSNKEYFK